jgi:hypothetical protein
MPPVPAKASGPERTSLQANADAEPANSAINASFVDRFMNRGKVLVISARCAVARADLCALSQAAKRVRESFDPDGLGTAAGNFDFL